MMRRRGPGLVRTAARTAVIAGTATAVSGRVAQHQQDKYMAEHEAQYEPAPAPAPTMPAGVSDAPEYTAELEKLAKLKAQGVISEEEFAAKKRQILQI